MIGLLAFAAAAVAVPGSHSEMELRCTVAEDAPLFARHAPPIAGPLSGGPAVGSPMKPLPGMMVVGWSVDHMPIADALGQLAGDAGFTVVSDPGLSPVTWNGDKATPLGVVVTRLAQQAGGVPSFDGRVLTIARPAPAIPYSYARPSGRDETLALLDALRGYGATDVRLGTSTVTFQASDVVAAKIGRGLAGASNVIAFDVWSYMVKPVSGPIDWKPLEDMSTVTERHPGDGGARYVVNYIPASDVKAFLSKSAEVRDLGSQTVAGPQGWAIDVPLAQCGDMSVRDMSLMLKPTWTGTTMSVDLSGAVLGSGRIAALPPGSAAIISGPASGGWIPVAFVRPRVLSSK